MLCQIYILNICSTFLRNLRWFTLRITSWILKIDLFIRFLSEIVRLQQFRRLYNFWTTERNHLILLLILLLDWWYRLKLIIICCQIQVYTLAILKITIRADIWINLVLTFTSLLNLWYFNFLLCKALRLFLFEMLLHFVIASFPLLIFWHLWHLWSRGYVRKEFRPRWRHDILIAGDLQPATLNAWLFRRPTFCTLSH